MGRSKRPLRLKREGAGGGSALLSYKIYVNETHLNQTPTKRDLSSFNNPFISHTRARTERMAGERIYSSFAEREGFKRRKGREGRRDLRKKDRVISNLLTPGK